MRGKGCIPNLNALVMILSFALIISVSIFVLPQEACAATSVKVGNFQSGTSTGNVNVTGVGFQPKAVIFYWTRQSATGFSTGESIGKGFAAGSPSSPVNRGVAIACDDAANPTNCGRRRSGQYSIMFLSNGNPTLSGQGSVTSFNADGFTVNWNTAPGVNAYINYLAIGGDDITNANAGTITAGTTAGNQAFTGVGFQPDFVMFLSGSTESVDTNTTDMLFNTGFMDTAGEQAAVSVCGRDARSTTPHARSGQRTVMAIMGLTNTCGQDWLAGYSSMDADGFTLNFYDAPAAATDIFYLALQGGTHKIGSFTTPGWTQTQNITSVGFQPIGLFMESFNKAASDLIAAEGEISIGAASSSTERGTIWGETRDVIASDANMSVMTDKAIRMATGPTPTIDAEAVFSSFLSNGFSLDWTIGTLFVYRQIVYWAMASNSTIVGNNDGGGEPSSVTLCPGDAATMLDAFTLNTSAGTDTVTEVTVTLQSGTYAGLSLVEITDDAGSTVYGSVSNPSSNDVSITLGTNINVTTSPVQYKVRITPKSHAAMPLPTGTQYYVRGTVTGITSANTKIYNDSLTGATTITVDNQSTLNPSGFSGIPGDQQVVLNWTNPGGFSDVLILRNTIAIADTPVEGTTYSQGNTIGTSTVRYVGTSNNFTDTGLTNGQTYYYKIFAKDACGNYSTGATATGQPYTSGLIVTASSSGTQAATMNAGDTAQYIGAAFRFQQLIGTADTITALTITETGNVNANTKLTNVEVYYESDVASCSYDGTESSYSTSFDASDKIVLSSTSIPVSLSPNYTCVYVVFDVDSSALNNTTVDLEITSSADFTLSGGITKAGSYPVALSGTTTISGPNVGFVKVGNFQSGTSTGNVNVTGVGFQPKAVIFYWTRQSATGFSTSESIGKGFAAGSPSSPVNRGVAIACDDAANPTNCGKMRSEQYSIMFLSNGTPTLSGRGSVTLFDQDGFTVNWNTAPGVNAYINYMAIGGSVITNADAGTITAAASAGDQAFTGVGFEPDFVMFLSGLTESVDTATTNMHLNTGFMDTSGEQAAVSVCGRDNRGVTGHARNRQRTDMAIMGMTNTCGQDWLASYVSMDTDGFTLNFGSAPAAATDIFYLALEGGTHKIGSFNTPSWGSSTQNITSVGFQPIGLFMESFNRATNTGIAAEGEISIGAASSSTERGTIWGETRDVIASDANMSVMTDKAIRMATADGTDPPTIDAEADFNSFLTNGFSLNWTVAISFPYVYREIIYWAFANNATTVGNNDGGGEPSSVTLCPGDAATMLDAFTLNTSVGTDTVTDVTVTLSAGTYAGLSLVEITDNGGSTVYGSVSDPSSNAVQISVTGMPTVTTSPVQYKVRITPKTHAAMPLPIGLQYNVTGTVTGITSANTKIYSDSGSATITVDNRSTLNPSGFIGSPGEQQVVLNWNNPGDSDFTEVVLLRKTSAILDKPDEGATYSQGNTIGTSTVRYVGSSNTFTDTGLTNGVSYYYKIFAKDACGNYSTGAQANPYPSIPVPVVTAASSGTQVATMNAGDTAQYIGAAFTFQQSSGSADTISALTISETGNVIASTKLTNVEVYYESDVASCSYDGTESSYSTSFDASDKIVLSSTSIPVSLSPNYTCVYVVFDVDSSALNNTTIDLEITSSADFTLSGGTLKEGSYPVALTGTTTINGPDVSLVKVGNFQSGTSAGNVNVTGVGFQPKAVIFYWTRQSATGFSTGESIGKGFAAGSPFSPDNRGAAVACDDAANPTNCGKMSSEQYSIMFLSNGTPTLSGRGSVTLFDQDGFTVNWNTAPGVNAYINYMAIGGSVITNANAGTITAAASTGDQAFTGVGFQPDFVMFLSGLRESFDTATTNMHLNTGFMNTSGEQAAVSVCGRDGQTTTGHARNRQRTDRAIMGMTNTCGADSVASYGSMDADGFTLYFNNAPGAATDIFYLALQGGTHKIGSFTSPGWGSSTQNITEVGIQPIGLFLESFNRAADTGIAAEGEISIGAASSSTERGTIWGETRDVIASDANMSVMTDKAIRMATADGTDPPTIDAEADFNSFLTNGFSLNWTVAFSFPYVYREIIYWAFANNSTTVGDNDGGGEPSSVNLCPGDAATMLDAFTLKTSSSSITDTVTDVTVTLAAGTYAGLSLVEITDNAGSTVYGSVSNPTTNDVFITLGTNINVTVTPVQYKVRVTPKSHAAMPVPPGLQYDITGTVTAVTSTYTKIYSDSGSATVTVDNYSASPTGFSGVPSEGQVLLTWTNPGGFSDVLILRNTTAISDTPVEGTTYSQGNTIGTSTVRYVGTSNNFNDTGLTNGQTYYYKIFARDACSNYSVGESALGQPYIPNPVVTASKQGTQKVSIEAGDTNKYIGARFIFQQSSGTPDNITALTISDTGTAVANTILNNVKVYWESGVSSCSSPPTSNSIDTSFNASEQIVLSSISIPVAVSSDFTCIYVVFDVNELAVKDSTVDLEITSSADFTLAAGFNKAGNYPVALNGTTTLVDTTPPDNITGLTAKPDDTQITLNWTNPSTADYAGVRIRRDTGGYPADCSSGTQVADVPAPGTAYTNTGLTNNIKYYYRLCSYDETPNPNYSVGVTISATPSSIPILSYPEAPYDDGKDPDTGNTATDFRFKVIYTDYQDPLGDPPDFASGYPKIYIGDNDGYMTGYTMSLDTSAPASLQDGDYRNGEQYVYGPVGLGAAEDLRFYFKAQAASGDTTVITLPSDAPTSDYSEGPPVYLLEKYSTGGEYNMVGVPKDLSLGYTYSSVLGDDSGILYCYFWDSYGLDTIGGYNGEYVDCSSEDIEQGKGYYIFALFGYGPYRLDEPIDVENVTAASVDIALDPDGGWTMISNPYNARIKLEDVKVVKDSIEYTFSQAVTNEWIGNAIYEWEGSISGYIPKAYNGSPPAVLDPWVGFYLYVKDTTDPIILRVYEPAP